MTEEMELDDTGLMLLEDDEDTNDQVATEANGKTDHMSCLGESFQT